MNRNSIEPTQGKIQGGNRLQLKKRAQGKATSQTSPVSTAHPKKQVNSKEITPPHVLVHHDALCQGRAKVPASLANMACLTKIPCLGWRGDKEDTREKLGLLAAKVTAHLCFQNI